MELIGKNTEIQYQIGLDIGNFVAKRKLYPILKWAGGKEQELKYIIPNLPRRFANYYEPFVGGGAVYTAIHSDKYFINDKSDELISLYRIIKDDNKALFFQSIEGIIQHWDLIAQIVEDNSVSFIETYKKYSEDNNDVELKNTLFEFLLDNQVKFNEMFDGFFDFSSDNFMSELRINLLRKVKRMRIIEKSKQLLPDKDIIDNIETALKSAFYMHIRHMYNNMDKYQFNDIYRVVFFLFIRNFAYSGMFRYNSNGDFNVPYGGIGYNKKNFQKKIDYLKTRELQSLLDNTTIENLDFEDFLKLHTPNENDFIFLDPPYDSEFSTYAQNEFTQKDQIRLVNYLTGECKAKWMMIIKNTDFIYSLYSTHNLNIRIFDKTYLVSFMNRNDKNVEHLIITNY